MIRAFYRAEVYHVRPDVQGLAWLVLLELSHSTVTIAACSTEAEAEQFAATFNAARESFAGDSSPAALRGEGTP